MQRPPYTFEINGNHNHYTSATHALKVIVDVLIACTRTHQVAITKASAKIDGFDERNVMIANYELRDVQKIFEQAYAQALADLNQLDQATADIIDITPKAAE